MRWEMTPPDERAISLAASLGFPPVIGDILMHRGIVTVDQARSFLSPRLAELPDPFSLADMEAAVDRLARAVGSGESIVIYGDYDVDGVTSIALLQEFLTAAGAKVLWYIPHRQEEGYGLNPEAVRQLVAEGFDLMVTVDCGMTAHQEIELAQSGGLDVIITDHHQSAGELPPARAVINPLRSDSRFPDDRLAGVGVAFHLAAALRSKLRNQSGWPDGEPDIRSYLDLVALGTVADVVPLLGVNRILTAAGLKTMVSSPRPGVQALARFARVTPPYLASHIAFKLAPRINARGRMAQADDGVHLLLTRDPGRAYELAMRLDRDNAMRRETEQAVIDGALELIEKQPDLLLPHSLVLVDESWHPGVIGIAASRLVERFHRPCFVIGQGGRGSGRSISGVDLHATLTELDSLLAGYGGHRAAAGLTIEPGNVDAFRRSFEEVIADSAEDDLFVPRLAVDGVLDAGELGPELYELIDQLEPCGMANRRPVFVSQGLPVIDVLTFGDGHLKLILDHPSVNEAVGFSMAERAADLPAEPELAYSLAFDSFRGERRPYLKLKDFR